MPDLDQSRQSLQETMSFMTALAYGLEQVADRGANGMAFVAGKKLGQSLSQQAKKTDNVDEALDQVRQVLEANSCLWGFETFVRKDTPRVVTRPDGTQVMELVFRDCMIRQSLFRYGHVQKGSICYMMYGFFSGALEQIMDRKAVLDITHAGQNACLKTLTIHPKG